MVQQHRVALKARFGHPDIVVGLDGPLGPDVLVDHLRTSVGEGVAFHDGETIQFGSSILRLVATEAGDLEIWEPDFANFPIRWVPGATATLRDLMLQRAVCEAVGVEPDFPSLLQPGIVASAFMSGCMGFALSREEPEDGFTGWFFKPPQAAGDEGRYASLYEVVLARRGVAPFLALPSGAEVIRTGDSIEVRVGGASASADSDAVLRGLLQWPA